MNKETGLLAIYAKNITPLVKGDEVKWYRNGTWVNATVKNEKVNTIYPGQLHTNKGIFSDVELSEYGVFVVSFADRTNTTGKQPVDDDVVVDTEWSDEDVITDKAGNLGWFITKLNIVTWKPNHEAMLAKFKEQGANTMFTFENTKEATHKIGSYFKKIIPGNMPEFLSKDGVWLLSSFSVKSALTHKSLIELSRPIGERKEDHTIDGILKKAQPQGAKAQAVALTIEALDDNPDEQVIEPESMIASSEFYQSNNPQVIEPYVADHLKGLINPVSEGCQAGDVISVPYSELPPCNGEIPKPVFTQEAADSGGKPKAMMECLIFNTLLDNPKYEKAVIDFIGEWCCVYTSESCRERSASVDDLLFKPIDNRTDKEKTSCALWDCIEQNDGDLNESSIDAFRYDLLSKFTITLNK